MTKPTDDDAEASRSDGAEEARPSLRILWGRLVALLVVGGLVFAAGRATAPSGVSPATLERTRRELRRAQAEIDDLQASAAEVASPSPAASPEPAPEETEGTPPAPETYVVKPGDTLQSIAERFYEDRTLDRVIAKANDITDPSQLTIGRELVIPNRPQL
jgi:nucleoid-associated protein YgaU